MEPDAAAAAHVQGYHESLAAPLVCVIPADALRSGLSAGPVSSADVAAAVDPVAHITVVEVTGRTLKRVLRAALAEVRPRPSPPHCHPAARARGSAVNTVARHFHVL